MAFKVGDKAKVVDKESLLYNKTVELIEVSNKAYIFNSENQKLKLVVHKDAIPSIIEWESSPDRAKGNLDKLLGHNGELVEERKKQVLAGAFGIIRQHYKDKPNKTEMVAKLFGKKLGEEFRIRRNYYISCSTVKARFMDRGFQTLYDGCDYWIYDPERLSDLIIGKAVIVDE